LTVHKWNKSLEHLNQGPARITLNGKRHYVTPLPTGPAPSVTTIISETASEANKKKLEMWSKANPGVKEQAAERGTAIHYGMEQYLKGNKSPEIKEELTVQGLTTYVTCTTWIRFYNSPLFDSWNVDNVKNYYYEKTDTREVK